MTPSIAARHADVLPPVKHLGFDHGWLMLGPTFINFQLPVLLVDSVLVGDPIALGLEQFGSRIPAPPVSGLPSKRSNLGAGCQPLGSTLRRPDASCQHLAHRW